MTSVFKWEEELTIEILAVTKEIRSIVWSSIHSCTKGI